jgi:ATP-dependent DNA ligase
MQVISDLRKWRSEKLVAYSYSGDYGAGRVGTGMSFSTLGMLHERLKPLAIRKMALAVAPPRKTRFGGRLALFKAHCVLREMVAEIAYLTSSDYGRLRHICRLNRGQAGKRDSARNAQPTILAAWQNSPMFPKRPGTNRARGQW